MLRGDRSENGRGLWRWRSDCKSAREVKIPKLFALAAACAANGEFAEALEVAVQEGRLAREQGDAALAGALEADLSTYRMRIGSKYAGSLASTLPINCSQMR
jgi:hypothetical protein